LSGDNFYVYVRKALVEEIPGKIKPS